MEFVKANPCIETWGPGPEGVRCKTCAHLLRFRYSRAFYKCEKRRMSSCAATDHRVNWPACGKYQPQGEDET